MKVYVAICGFQGCIDKVSVHMTPEGADAVIDKHLKYSGSTVEEWYAALDATNESPNIKYDLTSVFVAEVRGL